MSRKESNHFHLVVSVKHLQSIDDLEEYYVTNKDIENYIITIESGTTGHQHLESFVQLNKLRRQDKFRESIINKLYTNLPKEECKNIKVTINYLDPNPLYAIGYALKENPQHIHTNYSQKKMIEAKEYYNENCDKILKLKEEAKTKYKGLVITVDLIANEYLNFCKESGKPSLYYHSNPGDGNLYNKEIRDDITFKNFMIIYEEIIPFSLYQKINLDKLGEWTDTYMRKGARSLD